jgi:cobalt/nickel transport system permease protein
MKIENSLFEIGALDQLAGQDTPVHRLDPRAKLITTLGFIVTVVSFNRYELSALVPLILYPVSLAAAGNFPTSYLVRKLLIASPFALLVGLCNPILDRTPMFLVDGVSISAGWISFASIALRFCLTVSAALVLVGVTGFTTVCMALGRLGMPRIFTVQLLFLYRYIFVLTEEGLSMARARALRSFKRRGMGLRVYGYMLGQLLLRTMSRAERIHQAMLCRGFDGEIRLSRDFRFRSRDVVFAAGWLMFFGVARYLNLSQLLGRFVESILS